MSSISIALIGFSTVFSGLLILVVVVSLFPFIFKEKPSPAAETIRPGQNTGSFIEAETKASEGITTEDEDEIAAVTAAVIAMFEDETGNVFIRNR